MFVKRGDVLTNNKGNLEFVVENVVAGGGDKPARFTLYSPTHKLTLNGTYEKWHLEQGVLKETGRTMDLDSEEEAGVAKRRAEREAAKALKANANDAIDRKFGPAPAVGTAAAEPTLMKQAAKCQACADLWDMEVAPPEAKCKGCDYTTKTSKFTPLNTQMTKHAAKKHHAGHEAAPAAVETK